MKRSNWFFFAWFLLASFSQAVVLGLANFEYNLFRDPFSPSKFATQFGTFIGFAVVYSVVLGRFWKPRQQR